MADWLRLTLEVAEDGQELVVTELWRLGTSGIEERPAGDRTCLRAFFAASSPPPVEAAEIGGAYWRRFQASLDGVETITERDWTESYRRRARVFELGRGFRVDPREPGGEASSGEDGRTLLRLPARQAFGIGSHESTRLVVAWVEELPLAGRRVLDVGTGTGILALVALSCGAAEVTAIDLDLAAAFTARSNQRLNGISFPLVVGGVDALGPDTCYDLALVNVLPERIESDLEQLHDLVRPGGRAIFSGILTSASDRFLELLENVGLSPCERRVDREWEAWMTERAGE